MYWVYILKNRDSNDFYYGYTNDLERRIEEHTRANSWELVGCEGYKSELDAREREKN